MTIKHITDTSSNFYEQAIRIYQESFPANERQSILTIHERVKLGKSILLVGIKEVEVISMALLWKFEQTPFVLLDYFAIAEKYRGQKFGTQFFSILLDSVKMEKKIIIIEVEHYLFGENKKERLKRIKFYLRNGAYLLKNVRYMLPALDNTISTEMLLMIAPGVTNEYIDQVRLRELISRLHIELYGKNSYDEELISLMEQVPESVIISNTLL